MFKGAFCPLFSLYNVAFSIVCHPHVQNPMWERPPPGTYLRVHRQSDPRTLADSGEHPKHQQKHQVHGVDCSDLLQRCHVYEHKRDDVELSGDSVCHAGSPDGEVRGLSLPLPVLRRSGSHVGISRVLMCTDPIVATAQDVPCDSQSFQYISLLQTKQPNVVFVFRNYI